MKLKQLAEQRGELMRRGDDLVNKVENEKRDFTPREQVQFAEVREQILKIDTETAKIHDEMRRDLSRVDSRGSNNLNLEGYSLCRAIAQAGQGRLDGLEAEISQEIARRSGKAADGFFVPHAALIEQRSGMTVSGDSGIYGGKTVATEVISFVDALRPMLAVARAGATIFSGLSSNIAIPRHVAASTAGWLSEVETASESTPEIEQLELTPKRIGSWTKFSKRLVSQSSLEIEQFVRNDLMQAIAIGFDSAAINGTGANNQPTGILATAGIGSVVGGTNGLAPTWAHLTALVAAVANKNAIGSKPAFLFSTKVESKLRSTQKIVSSDSVCLLDEGQTSLVGNQWYASNNCPDNLTKGNATAVCSAIIFGNFEDVILATFGEGVDLIVDPYTLATSGQTRVVCNSLCDVGIRRAESFSAMKDSLCS